MSTTVFCQSVEIDFYWLMIENERTEIAWKGDANMAWTEREKAVWEEIMAWEQSMADYDGNDFQYTYSKWLNAALATIPEEALSSFSDS